MKRRDFLKLISVGTCGSAIHNALSPAGNFMAFADPGVAALGNTMKVIVVNLAGGCSYNIMPPFNTAYYTKNPTISYNLTTGLKLGTITEQGLHPSLLNVKSVFDDGDCAMLNLVGYPNPNQSHDESTEIFFRGIRAAGATASGGWAARLACAINESIFNGISLSGQNTLVSGGCNPPRALGSLANFGERNFYGDSDSAQVRQARDAMLAVADPPRPGDPAYVREAKLNLARSIVTIQKETKITLPYVFPNTGFGNSCRDAAKLIAAPSLKVRFIYMQTGGYDTHSDERVGLANRLTELDGGLGALVRTLKYFNEWDNTIILTMSDFCRTFENGSRGTDHGHAGGALAMGGRVIGGIHNDPPSDALTAASNGYYRNYDIDFREVFGGAVAMMGVDPGPIFPEAYTLKGLSLFS